MSKIMNVKFAGLGGQGILTCTDILGRVVFDLGNDVKKAEVHGMSQRGGAITSDLRFGEKVMSPMIPAGMADLGHTLGQFGCLQSNRAKGAVSGNSTNVGFEPLLTNVLFLKFGS